MWHACLQPGTFRCLPLPAVLKHTPVTLLVSICHSCSIPISLSAWASKQRRSLLIGPDDGYQAETRRPLFNKLCCPLCTILWRSQADRPLRLVPQH